MIPGEVFEISVSDFTLGGVISVAVSVLAILFAVKCKYSTAKWRGAGARCFWFSLLFILPTLVVEILGEALFDSINWGGQPFLKALFRLTYYIVFVGASEEAGKILGAYTGTGGYHRVTSRNDILHYALISAAAFTGLENILYYIRSGGSAATAILRAAISSPFHITCTMLVALGVVRSLQEKNSGAKIKGFIVAVLIHGCYDFVADYVMQSELSALGVLFVLFMAVAMIFVVLNILKAPRRYAEANSVSVCKNCGSSTNGFVDRCSACGAAAFIRRVEFAPVTFPQKPEPEYPQQMGYYPMQQPYVQPVPTVQPAPEAQPAPIPAEQAPTYIPPEVPVQPVQQVPQDPIPVIDMDQQEAEQ